MLYNYLCVVLRIREVTTLKKQIRIWMGWKWEYLRKHRRYLKIYEINVFGFMICHVYVMSKCVLFLSRLNINAFRPSWIYLVLRAAIPKSVRIACKYKYCLRYKKGRNYLNFSNFWEAEFPENQYCAKIKFCKKI